MQASKYVNCMYWIDFVWLESAVLTRGRGSILFRLSCVDGSLLCVLHAHVEVILYSVCECLKAVFLQNQEG